MKRKVRGFGEAAHVARISVGREDRLDPSRVVTDAEITRIGDRLAERLVGVTVYPARGRYRYTDGSRRGQMANEPTAVFEIAALKSQNKSCAKFRKKLHDFAAEIAEELNQESVLVAVTCDRGNVDVDFIGRASVRRAERRQRRAQRERDR